MSSIAIHGEGLGKRYHRGAIQESSLLRDHLGDFLKSPMAFFRRPKGESFWALKDVSIEVHEGEVLGLIGRNGAGKTTLMKILSRITRPTTGWAEIRGRVRSLLEVGTGFHGELTGRENTYLSGSILGMGKREIKQKFDEIVAFAEIEKFIDTPVKHYSSGMYVRLAFAVAAHLEPEILLVDEVLAVGDLNFQKKCLGKMGDVAKEGRTIVLVSHQMNQMRRLCNRVVWIDDGHVRLAGATHEVVSTYEAAMVRGRRFGQYGSNGDQQDRCEVSKGRFVRWQIARPHGGDPHTLMDLEPVALEVVAEIKEPIMGAKHGIALYNCDQQLIWAWSSDKLLLKAGEQRFCHSFPMLPLRPGLYNWLVTLYDQEGLLDWWHCVPDMVVGTDSHQSHLDEWHGVLNVPDSFEIKSGAL